MRRFTPVFCSLFIAGTLCAAPLVPVKGRVVKSPLNVRAGAGTQYTAVGRLSHDNQVEITAAGKEWLEIRAPENTATWIMARYIRNNRLTTGVVLRAGPGISYEALGSAKAGMTVKVESGVTPNGWVLIRPFYWTRVYVGRGAIEADEKALAALPAPPRGAPPPNRALARLESSFTQPAELNVAMTGYLYPVEEKNSVFTHILYREKGEELVPEAYVASPGSDWRRFHEKKVTVTGCRGVGAGCDLPILIAGRIQAAR